jgi:hypothetical protein
MTPFGKKISTLAGMTTTELTPFWFLLVLIGLEMLWAECAGMSLTELLPGLFFMSAPIALGRMLNAAGVLERVANALRASCRRISSTGSFMVSRISSGTAEG